MTEQEAIKEAKRLAGPGGHEVIEGHCWMDDEYRIIRVEELGGPFYKVVKFDNYEETIAKVNEVLRAARRVLYGRIQCDSQFHGKRSIENREWTGTRSSRETELLIAAITSRLKSKELSAGERFEFECLEESIEKLLKEQHDD